MDEFRRTVRREEAALLVAQDELSNEGIAERVGVTRQALDNGKRQPEFAAWVQELVETAREQRKESRASAPRLGVSRRQIRSSRTAAWDQEAPRPGGVLDRSDAYRSGLWRGSGVFASPQLGQGVMQFTFHRLRHVTSLPLTS